MARATKKKNLFRSSESGEIVTQEFAEEHPATTQKETIKASILPITEDFGGNLNILRDKINEIITRG